MNRYFVVTPGIGVVEPILDDGTGPMEYHHDVVEVEAESKRDAIAFGVRLMLLGRKFTYCQDQRSNGCAPYTGVKAEALIDCDPSTPRHQDCDCMSCRPWTS